MIRKNGSSKEILIFGLFVYIRTWVMELFFLLSGVGTLYALRSSRAGAYTWERIKRLLIRYIADPSFAAADRPIAREISGHLAIGGVDYLRRPMKV